MVPPRLLVICGATATGKSDLALQLATRLGAEIISADSMQVYRGMDIGTAKLDIEQRTKIPHHLIDLVDPDRPFSAADFAEVADVVIREISRRGKSIIVAGGSGLYIKALLKGLIDAPTGNDQIRSELQSDALRLGNGVMFEKLRMCDPTSAAHIHPNNLVRIIRALEVFLQTGIPLSRYQHEHGFAGLRYQSLQLGIAVDRQQLYNRIDTRVDQMLDQGFLQEVQRLMNSGFDTETKALRSIGYKEMIAHIQGEYSLDEATRRIKRATRQYAKRQFTWFKADKDILWFEYPSEFDSILKNAIEFFDQKER